MSNLFPFFYVIARMLATSLNRRIKAAKIRDLMGKKKCGYTKSIDKEK